MAYYSYFDSPTFYQDKFDFYEVGSSPLLLEKLLAYIEVNKERITEINLWFYLFNNVKLNDALLTMADSGIKVTVITIPIEGYDVGHPKDIIDKDTREVTIEQATKYGLARSFFGNHYTTPHPNFRLLFFPHMYVRSENVLPFSRGNMPYSLHTKSMLIKFRNATGTLGISSSNFAVRDLVKEENLLLIEGESVYTEPAEHFLQCLADQSIPITEFDFKRNYTDYQITLKEAVQNSSTGFITPFFFNSAFHAEDKLMELISQANSAIWIIGQHICPIGYAFPGRFHSEYNNEEQHRPGLLSQIIAKAGAGVSIRFISQTFTSGDDELDGNKFRKPANKASFVNFFDQIRGRENITYAVNQNAHSKYIIVDDILIVTSYNYTPTQFIYLDQVNIPQFKNIPGTSYSGIYSEVGHHCIVNDVATVNNYKRNFEEIIGRADTIIIQ